jgi:hypothetical protein
VTERMHPAGAQQTFGLGSLVGAQGATAPSMATIEIEGRGVFAKVRLSFEFADTAPGTTERLFLLEKPSDAVPSQIALNGQPLAECPPREARSVPRTHLAAMEEALTVPSSHLMAVEVAEGVALEKLFFEFIVAVDLQWHRGAFLFRSPEGVRQVSFSGRWELAGLPGAGISFTEAASPCRLETLEASRHRWSESLTVGSEQPAVMEFSLDEKKAASIAVYSPSESSGPGCAAVAVIAPVRPQLARDAVRLALLVEVRNPQEALLIRNMVERAVSLLKAQDEFCVMLVGTDSPTSLVPWSSAEAISDDLLARLLEPTVIGRAPDLWANMQSVSSQLRGATHHLLATSGAPTYPGKGMLSQTPVFIFATGHRPFKSQLESLSQRSGGFLMQGSSEAVETLVERMRIRLSPPLLSDFKLEGWALTGLRPAGATQVYTDQPTLVFGLFEGLLPKTVTLSGQSPSRQKLAQRVKVENLEEIDLMPLYLDRVARWDGESDPVEHWSGDGVVVCNISHAEALPMRYTAETASPSSSEATMAIEMEGPPTILFAHSAVTMDDAPMMGAPEVEQDTFFGADDGGIFGSVGEMFEGPAPLFEGPTSAFEGPSSSEAPPTIGAAPSFDESPTIGAALTFDEPSTFDAPPSIAAAPTFDGPPTIGGAPSIEGPPSFAEPDLFFSEPAPGDSFMGGAVQIRKAEPIDIGGTIGDEIDLFADPAELGRSPAPSAPEASFSMPVGPPTIFKSEDGDEAPAPQPPAVRPEPASARAEATAEESGKRRLLSWRRQEADPPPAGSGPAPTEWAPRTVSPEWSSEWLEAFQAMDPGAAERWLESCSIDQLGLAASLLEAEVVEGLLARLSPHRRRAVRTQIAWGRLLEGYECEQADRQLALSLTQHSL